jgi:anti-anti-sigma factor
VTDIASLFMWRRGHVAVAAITGEVDISNARQLEAAIAAELDGDVTGLVLDLGGLSFLDAAGVHLVQRLSRRVGGFALVAGDDSPPQRVLDLAGEHRVHPTEEDAVRAVG